MADKKQHSANNEEVIQTDMKKDPTIRQEFPGAKTSKEKIKAGKRNSKNNGLSSNKKIPIEDDVPKSDAEDLLA